MAKKRGDLGGKSKSKKSGKPVHGMHVRRAKSGHLIVTHKHKPTAGGTPMEDEDHIVPDGGMDDHIAEHMPPQEESAGSPSPASGGLMGAM